MRHSLSLALPALFLALGGCISEKQVIKLNADGSGTITITTIMKKAAIEQMRQMMRSFGGGEGEAKPPDLFSEEQAKAKAAKMGEGVQFVSAEKINTQDEQGLKATYSFRDITKLRISEQPDNPGGGPGGPGPGAAAPKSPPITFKFSKLPSGNLLLTVVNPPSKEPAGGAKDEGPAPPPGAQEPDEAQLAMMKEMLAGLKVSIQLEVSGKIVKTNSPHVSGNTVTLMEMDFDKFLNDISKLKKLAQHQPKSLDDAKALIKDFPGMKIHLDPEITVEFTAP